jgi:hypothetical protein
MTMDSKFGALDLVCCRFACMTRRSEVRSRVPANAVTSTQRVSLAVWLLLCIPSPVTLTLFADTVLCHQITGNATH